MKQWLLKLINPILIKYFSCNLVHVIHTLDSEGDVWKRIKQKQIKPNQIFDIGAARGEWSNNLIKEFPDAKYLLFDPLEENEIHLRKLTNIYPSMTNHCCALGERNGEIEINVHSDQTSKFESEWGGLKRTVKLRTLDSFLTANNDGQINFMKIDVQGAELDVLKGATKMLNSCKVIQVEISFKKVYNEAPIAHEIINFLSENGFRIYDMTSVIKRKDDRELLQADIFFTSLNTLFEPETWK
ncbi:MAG: FkbM family methyltransferase [Prolixibacteraceae bacterium]|nr:FkbM family methyltransferase [Prolixibacteraceae bacterium]